MRVLVTGHKGYIGTVMTPMLLAAGHEVVGYDSDLYRRCTYPAGGAIADVPIASQGHARRRGRRPRGLRRGDPSGGALQRSARQPQPAHHLRDQPRGGDPHGDRGQEGRRAALPVCLLLQQLRLRPATTCSTRPRRSLPSRPMAPPRSRPRSSWPAWRTRPSRPSTCARRPPTAFRRACASTSCSNNLVAWAVTTGRIHLKSDGSPWRPIVHIEDISRAFIAALEAPIEAVSNEAFNVGQTAHNYRIRDLAEIVAGVVPGCPIEFAEDAGPDTRNYRVSCDKIHRVLPAFQPQWDAARAPSSSTRPTAPAG